MILFLLPLLPLPSPSPPSLLNCLLLLLRRGRSTCYFTAGSSWYILYTQQHRGIIITNMFGAYLFGMTRMAAHYLTVRSFTRSLALQPSLSETGRPVDWLAGWLAVALTHSVGARLTFFGGMSNAISAEKIYPSHSLMLIAIKQSKCMCACLPGPSLLTSASSAAFSVMY